MNPRIARAFWFAHFTRTWPYLLAGLLLGIKIGLLYYVGFREDIPKARFDYGRDVDNFLLPMLIFAVPVQLLGLVYNPSISQSFSCRLPESTLLLPASSFSIAFHRFMFNLVAVSVSVLLLFGLAHYLFGKSELEWWNRVLLTAGLCAVMQCVALATAPTGDWTIGFLIAAAWIYLLGSEEFAEEPVRIFDLTAIVVSFLVMWANVHLLRQGRWALPSISVAPQPKTERVRARGREPKPFKSAWRAQLWLETRTYWRPISQIFVALTGIYLVIIFFESDVGRSSTAELVFYTLTLTLRYFGVLYFGVLSFVLGGVIVSLYNRRLQTGPMAAFLYLRPISTPQLASVRIAAALRVWMLCPIILVVFFAVRVITTGEMGNSPADALQWLIPTLALVWASLWTWNILALLVLYTITALTSTVLTYGDMTQAGVFIQYGLPAVIIAAALTVFTIAFGKRLVPLVFFGIFISVAVAALAIWCYLMWPLDEFVFGSNDPGTNGVLFASIVASVIAPLATVPLAHHWCRHR